MTDRKRIAAVTAVLAVACICMGLVDAVIQPGYAAKSLIKIAVFLGLPGLYCLRFRDRTPLTFLIPRKSSLVPAIGVGLAVYAAVLGAYLIFRNVFDFSALTGALTAATGVEKRNFLWVALYISFVNSFLEEWFFRGFGFLQLKRIAGRKTAYCISAGLFALYHIAMMIGWFHAAVTVLALLGLFAGGLIFNFFDEKQDNIFLSWLIHMFANFATNTIGFLLFQG